MGFIEAEYMTRKKSPQEKIMERTQHPIMFGEHDEQIWCNGNITFENGDGTRYTCHFMPAKHGGVYVICNENSLWRYHGGNDLKFLCGNDNDWTRFAICQIILVRGFEDLWSEYL